MSTTIVPSLGAGLLFTTGGTGAAPGYSMVDLRRSSTAGLQEGVYAAGSFEVTQRAAGANLSVDIAASTHENGIAALVQGDSVGGQGLYAVGPHSAPINEAIAAAHATLPRVDRVVLEIQDNLHDASGANAARTRVITGTATAGATLANLTGAAAVPNNCLLLADVLVAATDTAIGNTEIRDRRKWARGAYKRFVYSSAVYTRTLTALAEMDSTNLKGRFECSGVPIRVSVDGTWKVTTAGKLIGFDVFVDGVAAGIPRTDVAALASTPQPFNTSWELSLAAGSHQIAIGWASGDGTAVTIDSTSHPVYLVVEEIVRQNTANNATTSG